MMKLFTALFSFWLRLVVLSSVFWLQWKLSQAASCYDFFTDIPKPCFPQPVNAATQRNITATNTCGTPKSNYCEIGPGSQCFTCDANSSLAMHPAIFMVDKEAPFGENPTWWQSETWWDTNQRGASKMGEPLKVNVTLNFGKSYHVSGKIKVTFYSERPHALIIERSSDNGLTWTPYQYFAKDCLATYGMAATESVPTDDPLQATCSEEYSGQFPSKNGIVEFQAYARYTPEDYMEPVIQEYMKATHVRLRLEYPGTDGLELINSEVSLNRYYYAISDVRVDGRCDCHGHAEFCDGVGMNQYCDCEHHTTGRDCERCLPMYNNAPWKAANKTHANECQKCDCNNHSETCSYDSNFKTGICHNCTNNTTGNHCDKCNDGFYRNVEKIIRDVDVCLACDCFPVGIVDDGLCNQELSGDIELGQCNCKENVFGRRCDECVPGYWGFRIPPGGTCQDCSCDVLGTINETKNCDQQTGNCFCKNFIEGEKCNVCSDGYYGFPNKSESSCLKCPCDLGGAFRTCEKEEGLCSCRQNIEGKYCDAPKSGYFVPSFDFLLFEAEFQNGTFEKQLEQHSVNNFFTGQGYARLTPQSGVHFMDIKVDISWDYYVVLRYTANNFPPNSNLSITSTLINEKITIPVNELEVGSGQAWSSNQTFYLEKTKSHNVTINLSSSALNGILLLDSLILKPNLLSTRVYKESQAESVKKLLECYKAANPLTREKNNPECFPLVFSHGAEMYDGAKVCDCDVSGTSQVDNCNPNDGQCNCYNGVGGRTCSYCLPGYHGFGDGPCKVCQCNSAGIISDICEIISGVCQCKKSTKGVECDQCKYGTFNLDYKNVDGCQSCFGYGHGKECKPAQGFIASQISSNFTDLELNGWRIQDNSTFVVDIQDDGLNVNRNLSLVAPPKYLGEQLKSYKQRIHVKVIPSPASNISRNSVSVHLKGHSYQALLVPSLETTQDFSEFVFTLDGYHTNSDHSLTEFHFQSMLTNLTSFEVIVPSGLLLKHVSMETAVYAPAGEVASHIGFVENMTCHENYTGLSCESCASGFTRAVPNSGPFVDCVQCSCNGRADECDPESGVCFNCDIGSDGDHCERCQYHVVGPYCNVCADGFYGLTEHDRKCKPCDCHLPGTRHSNTSSCNVTTGQCYCNKSLHTGGRRCNVCQENAWNRSDSSPCEECPPCFGMVKVEVDKFRVDFSTLLEAFRSLDDLAVFSIFKPFTTHIERTKEAVDVLVKTSLVLAERNKVVEQDFEISFGVLDSFAKDRDSSWEDVRATLNATTSVIEGYTRTRRVLEDTQELVISSYDSLSNTENELMDHLNVSLSLLHQWATTLNKTKFLSKTKVDSIASTRDAVNSGLKTAVQLATQAAQDAISVDNIFQTVLSKYSYLEINITSLRETAEKMMNVAKQRYHNATVLFNSTLELKMFGHLSNLSESMASLNESSKKIVNNALVIIQTVQNQVGSSLLILQDIYKALTKLHVLQTQVIVYQSRTTNYYTESLRYQAEAKMAVEKAEKVQLNAQQLLTTVRNFPAIVQDTKTRSDKAMEEITQMISSHRSNILLAINISIAMESFDETDGLVQLSRTVENYAEQESSDVSKLLVSSTVLKNHAAAEQDTVTQRSVIAEYVETMVAPVQSQCEVVTRDSHEALVNSTKVRLDAEQVLEKVRNVSDELQQVTNNYQDLPTIDTKPLGNMKADISRIRTAFEALKLSSSLEKLRQGKDTQEEWLAVNKPRVKKLRDKIALVKSFVASLNKKNC